MEIQNGTPTKRDREDMTLAAGKNLSPGTRVRTGYVSEYRRRRWLRNGWIQKVGDGYALTHKGWRAM